MSDAVRSKCPEVEPFGSWYTDHSTWCDLGLTRKTIPLPRPKDEFNGGPPDLLTRSANDPEAWSSPLSLDALTGSGFGIKSANWVSNALPIRSVKIASANFGSVTTWSRRPLVRWFARYWSSPCDIGSKYTEWTLEISCPKESAPKSGIRNTSRLMSSMIATELERGAFFGSRAHR